MSSHIAPACGRFRPESARDFSQRCRRLARWLGLPYQRSQELLARIYGYSDLHELRRELQRPGIPGPFDGAASGTHGRARRNRELRIVRLIAELKGVEESQLSPIERAVSSMGLFLESKAHQSAFAALANSHRTGREGAATRRVVAAPPPTHPSLPSMFIDVECSDDEDVEWTWTDTPAGRYVSGYRLIRRVDADGMEALS